MSFTGWKLTLLYLEITTLKRCIECVIVIGMGLKSWEGRQCQWIYASCDGSKEMKRNDSNGAPPKESSRRCVQHNIIEHPLSIDLIGARSKRRILDTNCHHSWRSRRRLRPNCSFDFSPNKIIQSPYCQAHPIAEFMKWHIGGTRVETRILELMTWCWRGVTWENETLFYIYTRGNPPYRRAENEWII